MSHGTIAQKVKGHFQLSTNQSARQLHYVQQVPAKKGTGLLHSTKCQYTIYIYIYKYVEKEGKV